MSLFQLLVTLVIVFLTGAVFFLSASQRETKKSLKELIQSPSQSTSVAPSDPSTKASPDTPFSPLENASQSLQASVSGLIDRIEKLENTKTTSTSETPIYSLPVTSAFQPQTIYLGSASSTNTQWTDSSVEVSLYSGDYPSGVKLYFEAGLSIIGGEAWARVKNKTTGAVISASEVFHNNNTVTWKYSPAFNLQPGNNVYVIQLKSTSNERANLAGARLKITK